jgi:hypothetical protein
MQSAMERALDHAVTALRDKAGEMSSMFANELEHFSRSYTDHTRGLLEEAARKVGEAARGELEVAAEAARTHVREEARRLAEQQIERAQRATSLSAGEVIARVADEARLLEQRAAQTAAGTAEQIEEQAARTRDEMQALHANAVAAFDRRLWQEIHEKLERAQHDLDAQLQPVLERWGAEREQLQKEWAAMLAELGGKALEEHREHLGNVANSLMVTTVASLSEHSQTILDHLAVAAEQRVRENSAQALAGLGEALRERLAALAAELAPKPGGAAPPAAGTPPAGERKS